jgi:hypothetical protein
MPKTQQEIVDLFRKILPRISEGNGELEIYIRGDRFTIPLAKTQTVVKGRTVNKNYGKY